MTEPTRALVYRICLLVLIGYVITIRPDTLADFVPIVVGVAASGLATRNTKIRSRPHD